MKKQLLLFFLFIFSFSFSQINTQVTPLELCDDNNDGYAVFDIYSKNPEVLGNLNPTIYLVTYHETAVDATFGYNALNTNYVNVNPFIQTLFVRVLNSQTSAVQTTQLDLIVNPSPQANPATLTFCGSGNPVYNLSDANNQIVNGQAAAIVQYYTTQIDAINGTNQIVNPTSFVAFTTPQIVFARVFSPNTGCFSTTNVTLNTCNQSLLAPTNLVLTNNNANGVTLTWTENNPGNNIYIINYYSDNSPIQTITSMTNSISLPFPPDSCFTFQVQSYNEFGGSSPFSAPLSFCTYNCSNNASCNNRLDLIAFNDINNNGIKDPSESNFNNGNFSYHINAGTPIYGVTNSGAFTIFESNPINTYNLSFAVNPNLTTYYSSATNYPNVTVPAGSGTTTYYFPITQLQPYNDLEVQIIPGANPQPGFLYTNTIIYKNKGTQNVASGTVTFIKNASVSITSISQAGTTIQPSGFSYNFTNLAPNETRVIIVTMQVPTIPTVNLGQVLTNSATITPTSGDAVPFDNAASLSQIVVGSYDPNDKMEAHGGKININNFTANDYLVYTIRFENTGTANASFIRVEDELNSLLNAGTVEVLNASHAYNFRRINNNLIWNFYTINLPPTATNPTLSQGFIQFKVKPNPGYVVGTVISNSAEIYFDYNPPIFTGAFNTEFVAALNNSNFDASNFVLYPNPTSNFVMINIQNTSEKIDKIIVYDMIGKVIKAISNVNSNQVEMSTSEFSKGMYLIEISTENNLKQTKKLIVK